MTIQNKGTAPTYPPTHLPKEVQTLIREYARYYPALSAVSTVWKTTMLEKPYHPALLDLCKKGGIQIENLPKIKDQDIIGEEHVKGIHTSQMPFPVMRFEIKGCKGLAISMKNRKEPFPSDPLFQITTFIQQRTLPQELEKRWTTIHKQYGAINGIHLGTVVGPIDTILRDENRFLRLTQRQEQMDRYNAKRP